MSKKRGRPRFEKPDYWCVEWYKEQKEKGLIDLEIAENMGINKDTFHKWKKELGLDKWQYTFSYARPNK